LIFLAEIDINSIAIITENRNCLIGGDGRFKGRGDRGT
jgi:hypothetical protein